MRTSPRLVYVVTHPISASLLLRGQLAHMAARGFDVTVVSAPGPDLDEVRQREGVRAIEVPMRRDISAGRDAVSLVRLGRALATLRPDIVNASTTKGGLLGMMASRTLRVPVRIYLLRGLRGETTTGSTRSILRATEKVAVACAHEVVCVSESLRTRFVEEGYAREKKTRVLGAGSSNGVDVGRFSPASVEARRAARVEIGIPIDAFVVGFVGRLVDDKGVGDLLGAFDGIRSKRNAWLLVVGHELADDRDDPRVALLSARPSVTMIGRTTDAAPFYRVMDVLAFPSRREGFPNVPLEAAASGIPVVGYRVTGVVDAVSDGVTGVLVPRGDVDGFTAALVRYADDEKVRAKHGAAARIRVQRFYPRERLWALWADYYEEMLRARGVDRARKTAPHT